MDGKIREQSWVETKDLYCYNLAKKYIDLQLALPNCSFRSLLIDALENLTLREQMDNELDSKVDEIKVEISTWAANKIQEKNKNIAGLKKKIKEESDENKDLKRKWEKSVDRETKLMGDITDLLKQQEGSNKKAAKLEIDYWELNRKYTDSLKRITDLSAERDEAKTQHAALIVEYNNVYEYIQDQNNSIKYQQENPHGKIPVPQVHRQ